MRPLQAEIIKALGVQATIDPETEVRRSVDFLKAYLKKNTFKNLCPRHFGRARFESCWCFDRKGHAGNASRNRRRCLSIYCRSSALW